MAYVAVVSFVLCGFCSLAVDFGRVQMAKTQLRRAADAAAFYGAQGAASGNAASNAINAAADNLVDGSPLVLQNSDVVAGTWVMGGGFTAGGTQLNAVQVNAERTRARGTAIPLMFAQIIGQSTCDIRTTAMSHADFNPLGGIVGYSGIAYKNNMFAASYNSATNTNPTQGNYLSNGSLGSNAAIAGKNNNELHGNAYLGPLGSVSGIVVSGTANNGAPLVPPTMPAWNPGTNPQGISQAYTVSTATTLPGGVYWFTSLTISADLNFSGPTTIYVNGPITLDAALTAYQSRPPYLRVYQLTSDTFGDSSSNHMDITADVWAPAATFSAKNNFVFRGRAFFGSISAVKNNAEFYYDESFGPASGSTSLKLGQ